MTWKALNNWVTVKIDPPHESVVGRHGVIVPAVKTATFRTTGTVESVGPTCRIPELCPGARVLFPPYGAGQRNQIGRDEYISLLDWEVLGYFEG
jgi:hypothetical protein